MPSQRIPIISDTDSLPTKPRGPRCSAGLPSCYHTEHGFLNELSYFSGRSKIRIWGYAKIPRRSPIGWPLRPARPELGIITTPSSLGRKLSFCNIQIAQYAWSFCSYVRTQVLPEVEHSSIRVRWPICAITPEHLSLLRFSLLPQADEPSHKFYPMISTDSNIHLSKLTYKCQTL